MLIQIRLFHNSLPVNFLGSYLINNELIFCMTTIVAGNSCIYLPPSLCCCLHPFIITK